jgi:uncharacterized membrane protein YhhN
MKKIWFPVFVILSVMHLVGIVGGVSLLSTLSKPLLMPVLGLWLMAQTPGDRSRLRLGWLFGLLFSTVGDVLLMYEGGLFFVLGLLAFLLAHLSYIVGAASALRGQRGFLEKNPGWIVPFLVYPALLLYGLWPGIPEGMRVPVTVYAVVISTMAQSVVNLHGHIEKTIFRTMVAGALLFVLSDSLIAVAKFGTPFTGVHVAVISTYMVGQWLLVYGVSKVINGHKKATG